MPGTAEDHYQYTIDEWNSKGFRDILDAIPQVSSIVDIGANAGGWSVLMRRKYPEALIIAFEPLRDNFVVLSEKTAGESIFINKSAIWYGDKQSKLMWRGGGNVGAVFLDGVPAGEPMVDTGETVSNTTLESIGFIPDLVKMDVEGAEVNIIEHSDVLKKVKNIIIEWHPSDKPIDFFHEHLPNHRIVKNLDNLQFYLAL